MTTASSFDWSVPADHPSLAGHFPGRPIVPGVVLLALVTEALLVDADSAACVGAEPRLGAVKFLSPCLPGDRVRFSWHRDAGRLAFEARRLGAGVDDDDGTPVLGGHFLVTAG